MTNSINLLGVNISGVGLEGAVKLVINQFPKGNGDFFCFSNIHTLMETLKNREMRGSVNQAEEIFPDGMGVVLALKILGRNIKDRARGKDLMLRLCSYAATNNLAVAMYGTTQENLLALSGKIINLFPGIRIVKIIAPPFRELTPDEDKNITEEINQSKADILFVALSTPKQEKWMAEHKGKIGAVQLSVGSAFDLITGRVIEAPIWMQKTALEWFYRLFQQPKRVIYRMSLVPEFIFRLLLQIIKENILGIKTVI